MIRKLLVGGSVILALALVVIVMPDGVDPVLAAPQLPATHSEGLQVFVARLSGLEETPPISGTAASGKGVFVLSNNLTATVEMTGPETVSSTLYWRVTVADILSITQAHLHLGDRGESGPPVIPLFNAASGRTFDPAHPISGTLPITSTEVLSNLLNEKYYLNVHTTAYPTGEVRGQVVPWHMAPQYFDATLTGTQEVPPVDTDAAGEAHFQLDDAMGMLDYTIEITQMQAATMAHLHLGLPGQAGPPVITLYSSGDPRPFDPQNPISGTLPITPEHVLDLLTGALYANVHTTQYPGGETRGQALPMWRLFVPYSPVTVTVGAP